jgi:hypothetical protein
MGVEEPIALGISEAAARRCKEAFERARSGREVLMEDLVDDVLVDLVSGEMRSA